MNSLFYQKKKKKVRNKNKKRPIALEHANPTSPNGHWPKADQPIIPGSGQSSAGVCCDCTRPFVRVSRMASHTIISSHLIIDNQIADWNRGVREEGGNVVDGQEDQTVRNTAAEPTGEIRI